VALAPNFRFERFFASAGAPAFSEVNVVPPDFFQKVSPVVESVSLDDWKTYLRWHVVRAAAPMLSDPFVKENFSFYGQYLSGQKVLQPRCKPCVQSTYVLLLEPLAKLY